MAATLSRKQPRYRFQPGDEAQINSNCFIPEWVGWYVTVVCYGTRQPGKPLEVHVRTETGRELTLYEASLTPAN